VTGTRTARAGIALAAAALVAAAAWATWARPSTALDVPTEGGSFMDSVATQPPGAHTIFGAIIPCTKDGPVTVTAIRATEAHNGFVVDAWGSRPNPMARGGDSIIDDHTTLAAAGFEVGRAVVRNSCPLDTQYPASLELAVQVAWTSPDTTRWTVGLTIAYTDAHGRNGSLDVTDGTLVMCGRETPPDPRCTPAPP
jgi:hypothetical protein